MATTPKLRIFAVLHHNIERRQFPIPIKVMGSCFASVEIDQFPTLSDLIRGDARAYTIKSRIGRVVMAKRKKRAKTQSKKRAKLRKGSSAARRKTRKASKSARGTKRTVARVKPKRAGAKKAARKKTQRMNRPEVETVVVDVVEEPIPGVITVTEFEETRMTRLGKDGSDDND